eukprot:PRCOL_00006079-RA
MVVKRRNHGRSRKNCGSSGKLVSCDGCGSRVAKDKAVKRFRVTNMVESSAIRDLRDASMYEEYTLPKMYRKMTYCVGCAIHQRVVRGRSKKTGARKDRTPPMRPRQLEQKFSKDKERENRSAPANIPGNTPAPAAAAAAAPEQTA